jgi:hypothetical protein
MNLAENGSNKRGPYKPLEKAPIKQEIYRKILAGHSYEDIMQYLHMPERTFYRYLTEIKEEEKTFLLSDSISPKEIAWQLRLMRDGLREDIQRMLVISSDPNNRNAVAAQHLASEIRCTLPRLYTEGIVTLLKTKGFPNNELNDESKRTTLRLVEVVEEVKEEDLEKKAYDELDYPNYSDNDDDDEIEERQ